MSFEQQILTAPDWRPPSPTSATPQSSRPDAFTFQTPSEASPTHFRNAWMTPQSKPQMLHQQFTPTWPAEMHLLHHAGPDYISHNNAFDTQNTLQHFGSSNVTLPFAMVDDQGAVLETQHTHAQRDTATVATTFQMRTPPPTRDSTTRKKTLQHELHDNRATSYTSPRRMSASDSTWLRRSVEFLRPDAPSLSSSHAQYNPVDPIHFSFSGPATAPAYQTNIFWDPESSIGFENSPLLDVGEDPFYVHPERVSDINPASPPTLPKQRTAPSTARSKKKGQPSNSQISRRPAAAADVIRPAPFVSSNRGVNPSLLVASSDLETRSVSHYSRSGLNIPSEFRTPYEHQVEHAKREKALDRSRKSFANTPSSSTIQRNELDTAAPMLRRSLTDSRMKRSGGHSHTPPHASNELILETSPSFREAGIPRTASPLKRYKSVSHSSMTLSGRSSARTSVVLTVDEGGRARTEITPVESVVAVGSAERNSASPSPMVAPSDSDSDSSDHLFVSRDGNADIAHRQDKGSKASRRAARHLMSDLSLGPRQQSRAHDAQLALMEVVRDRQGRRRASYTGQVSVGYRSRSRPAADVAPFGQD